MKQIPFEVGKYYHIYNRGNNKQNIFIEEQNYWYFLRLMKKHLGNSIHVYAYCLLPNHFHMLVSFENGLERIHQPLANLFNSYSKAFNSKYGRSGSLFQKHLKRKVIDTEDSFRELILYIHLNPEKHGINDHFYEYNFSSYKSYLSINSSMLRRDEVIEMFGDKPNFEYCHNQKSINLELLKEIDNIDY